MASRAALVKDRSRVCAGRSASCSFDSIDGMVPLPRGGAEAIGATTGSEPDAVPGGVAGVRPIGGGLSLGTADWAASPSFLLACSSTRKAEIHLMSESSSGAHTT